VDGFGDQWNHFNFDDFFDQWHQQTVKNSFGSLDYFKDKVVIDCGAGHGMQSRWMAEAGAARVIALELSHTVDDIFPRNLQGLEDVVQVVQCSIDTPPLKPGCIGKDGLVICHNVIQHTPNVEKTAYSLWQLVGQGGEFAWNCYVRFDSPWWQTLRFKIYLTVRTLLQAAPFWMRWCYVHLVALLCLVPGLDWLLAKSLLAAVGTTIPGPHYLWRKWRGTVVNTFDSFGGHTYQHYLSLPEQKNLALALQPNTKLWRNSECYFNKRPMPIGLALVLQK
jgi:SAM-dependent methyltransferase